MSNKNSEPIFQLIKSLTKAEKRYFKLFAGRMKGAEDAKFIKLFDLIDKQRNYDESKIIEKEKDIRPSQLSNIKAHLYKQILISLRTSNPDNDVEILIREMLDYTIILYNKCLYEQSLKMLEKAKITAKKHEKTLLLFEILNAEKKLVSRFIKSNIEDKALQLINETESTRKRLNNITEFSNLSLKLYSFYLKIGFIRNQNEFDAVNNILYSTLPVFQEDLLSINEKIYLYNSFTGYYFCIQDFDKGYIYAKKWVELFDKNPEYIIPKIEVYIRAINNLLMAQSKLIKYDEFILTCEKFDTIPNIENLSLTYNVNLLLFKYASTHKINRFFLLGQFSEGVEIIDEIAEGLERFADRLDSQYIMIFYYKFACMYFGNNQYRDASYWLNKIINLKDVDLRSDILSFARILNLICHYELENTDLVDYYIRSTYRFLIKKQDLHLFQKYIMQFLKKLSAITRQQLTEAFVELREQLLPLVNMPYEKRAFIYFDIISWLESKTSSKTVQEIIKEKAEKKIRDSKNKFGA